jgi:4-hydroxybenzoate polyprenyltransferase
MTAPDETPEPRATSAAPASRAGQDAPDNAASEGPQPPDAAANPTPEPSETGAETAESPISPQAAPEGAQIADTVAGNWVDRYAPEDMRPYLRLSRADRPIGTWLLLLPCWWGLLLGALAVPEMRGWLTVWIFLACALGAFLMRGAGCTWNDITDRDIDPLVERTRNRPIAAGLVGVREALIWMAIQMAVAFLILLTFNAAAIALGVLALLPVVVYPFAKRFTWWPQAFLGIAFNWGALLAWTAQTGSLGLPAVLLYLAGIAWTLFYDTIYAHQDRDDDALIGVKSTARLFGDNTLNWLRGFLVASVVLMSLAIVFALAPLADPVLLSLCLAGAWAYGAHLNWQLGKLDIDDPEGCLRLFRSNRDSGLIVVLIFAGALAI